MSRKSGHWEWNARKRPSDDQSAGNFGPSVSRTALTGPPSNLRRSRAIRVSFPRLNRSSLESGDHTGRNSDPLEPGSENLETAPSRDRSMIHTVVSEVSGSSLLHSARWRSSGARLKPKKSLRGPIVAKTLPNLSNHVKR